MPLGTTRREVSSSSFNASGSLFLYIVDLGSYSQF